MSSFSLLRLDAQMQKAIILAEGYFKKPYGKTAHGLVRGSQRFEITGVLDSTLVGQDAGETLDGIHRNIPFFKSVDDALEQVEASAIIIGIAPIGGRLSDEARQTLVSALSKGLDLISGLHTFFNDDPELVEIANKNNCKIIDVRQPKPRNELHSWSGKILDLKTPRVAVLGTDCGLGKRTTAKMLTDQLTSEGVNAQMIASGQTGWLQGWPYCFILDTLPNDFVCGELEHITLKCAEETNPDVIFFEGQSSFRNPAGPCGGEFLLSGGAKYVVLQTAPTRTSFEGYGIPQPSLKSEIELIKLFGSEVIAISLNSENATEEAMQAYKEQIQDKTGLPVFAPLTDGVKGLTSVVKSVLERNESN